MKKTLFFIAVLLLVSCQKEKENNNMFTGQYLSKSYYTEDLRMFTTQGEIKDQDVIQQYLQKIQSEYNNGNPYVYYDADYPFKGAIDYYVSSMKFNIKFTENDKAYFNDSLMTEITLINDILYLEEMDSTIIWISAYEDIEQIFQCHLLHAIKMPLLSNNLPYLRGRQCTFFRIQGNKILFPVLAYRLQRNFVGGGNSQCFGYRNNIYNEDNYKYLKQNVVDTLLIQQSYIVLEK